MLSELESLLTMFELITDEFQSNKVSISRVYPCIDSLKTKLHENLTEAVYTRDLTTDLIASLHKRFGDLVNNDIFKIATFLDPNFGPFSFPSDERTEVIRKIKRKVSGNTVISTPSKRLEKKTQSRKLFYKTYKDNMPEEVISDIDSSIASYTQFLNETDYEDALQFWKIHETKWPNLANLAKKYLGVQATSASVERMFSISGHIFSNKRRRTGVKLFEMLVFFKA